MSYRLKLLRIKKPRLHAIRSALPVCESGVARAATSVASLPQCGWQDSHGVRCELHEGHEEYHACPDALFDFERSKRRLQGPVCRTRRGPPEYLYVPGPMCL